MSPQKRGELDQAQRDALVAAKANRDQANEAYREAVAAALRSGASVREMCLFTGLAMQTVSDWGHARGWPTAAQKRQRDSMNRRRPIPDNET